MRCLQSRDTVAAATAAAAAAAALLLFRCSLLYKMQTLLQLLLLSNLAA